MKKTIIARPVKKVETRVVKKRDFRTGYILLVALSAFVLYGNTIPNDYSFDDIYVTNNLEVKQGFNAIPKIITSLYANLYEDGKPLTFGYRPVVKISFAVEYGLFGSNPHVSHFFNVLLYALTGIVLFLLLRRLLRKFNSMFPLIITLLFMAHPAHTEVVSSLKNRDELITFLACISSLYFFVLYIERKKFIYLPLALLIYIIGYFSKPTVIIFFAVYPLVFYFFTDARFWKVLIIMALVLAVTYLCKTLPRIYLPGAERPVQFIENPLVFTHGPFVKIATGFSIMLFYMRLIIFPHPLLFYYGYNMIPVVTFSDPKVIVSIIIHIALFVVAILYFRKKHILSFAILIYLISVGTFSNILKPAMGIVADRFLYFPSFGFSIIVAYMIFRIFRVDPELTTLPSGVSTKIIIALLLILVPYTSKTIIRNGDWKTLQTLLDADIDRLGNSAKANLIYAGNKKGELMRRLRKGDKVDQSIRDGVASLFDKLDKAVSIYPEYYQAYNMRGSCYLSFHRDYSKGLPDFLKAVQIKHDYSPGYFNIGYCYDKLEQPDKAIYYYRKTIDLDPGNLQANINLTKIYRSRGNMDSALYFNSKSIVLRDSLEKLNKMRKMGK